MESYVTSQVAFGNLPLRRAAEDPDVWGMGGERERERERENSNSNSKTLFYKDCSLGSVKNLSNN